MAGVLERDRGRQRSVRLAALAAVVVLLVGLVAAIATVRDEAAPHVSTGGSTPGSTGGSTSGSSGASGWFGTTDGSAVTRGTMDPAEAAMIPDYVEIHCDGGTGSLSTPRVRTQRDGVHLRLIGGTAGGTIEWTSRATGNRGASNAGADAFLQPGTWGARTVETEPGTYDLSCGVGSGGGGSPIGTLEIVDAEGFWHPDPWDGKGWCPALWTEAYSTREVQQFVLDRMRPARPAVSGFGSGPVGYVGQGRRFIEVSGAASGKLAYGYTDKPFTSFGEASSRPDHSMVEPEPVSVTISFCVNIPVPEPWGPPPDASLRTPEDAIAAVRAHADDPRSHRDADSPRSGSDFTRMEAKYVRVDEVTKLAQNAFGVQAPPFTHWIVATEHRSSSGAPVVTLWYPRDPPGGMGSSTGPDVGQWPSWWEALPDHSRDPG